MKASDMYDQSVTASQGLPPKHELPTRLLNALRNAGFVEKQDGKEPRLKTNLLREAILDGTIWTLRNVGETYVKLLSEYLEQIEQHEAMPTSTCSVDRGRQAPLKAGLKRAASDALETPLPQKLAQEETSTITHMIPATPGWWANFNRPKEDHPIAYRIVAWIVHDDVKLPIALLQVSGWFILIPVTELGDYIHNRDPIYFDTYKYFEPPKAPLYTG